MNKNAIFQIVFVLCLSVFVVTGCLKESPLPVETPETQPSELPETQPVEIPPETQPAETQPAEVPETQPTEQFRIFKVRPIVILNNGITEWTENDLLYCMSCVNPVYQQIKLHFKFLETEFIDDASLFDILDDEFSKLCLISKNKAEIEHELAVFFVNQIEIQGTLFGGFSYYPSNLKGSIYQHGIAIAWGSCQDIIVHELGHAFNLLHPWETPIRSSNGPEDCAEVEKYCNIMSYCCLSVTAPECKGIEMTPQQQSEVFKWSGLYPRNLTLETPVLSIQNESLYTQNTQPAY